MEARSGTDLPCEKGWWFEPKWDGFRCLAFRDGADVDLRAKSGKPLGRYFPEVVAALGELPFQRFVLDGELIIEVEGSASFAHLQMRLHPAASRINRLAVETPSRYALFDILMGPDGEALLERSHAERAQQLAQFYKQAKSNLLILTQGTFDRAQAQAWLVEGRLEGVVAKAANAPYAAGERVMIKVKRQRTADCVVGGFRYDKTKTQVASLLLGLYDVEGRLNHVGFTSGLAAADKKALTQELEALRGGRGFTGGAPGGPSRWNKGQGAAWEALHPSLVVEVAFDHVSEGRLRHGARLVRFRPDKAPEQCRCEQLFS